MTKTKLIIIMAALLLSAGVQAQTDLPALCPSGTGAAPAGAPIVLTTFTVLADMARNVACDRVIVESLTRAGAEIHHYEPSPSDIVRAQAADLVMFNGLNLELWFEQFMGAVQDVPRVNLSDGIQVILIQEGAYRDLPNPHAWMSPQVAMLYVANIRDALTALDPANADAFASNATAYTAHLAALDTYLRESLAQLPPEQRYLVSCEGAFSYLTRDYDLQEAYLWAVNADQQGTPKQVAHVIDIVKANKIPAIFCESTINNEPQKVAAQDANARFGGALYVDSLSNADGPVPTYLELLRYDATLIVNGLLGK